MFDDCPNLVVEVNCGTYGYNYVVNNGIDYTASHPYTVSQVISPTCSAQGYTRYSCKCGSFSYTEDYVSALGHDYHTSVTAPTCTEWGYTTYTCMRCGEWYEDYDVEPNGHSYDAWYVVEEATCTEEGSQRRDCMNCDHYEIRTTDTAAHPYESVVTDPTCTQQGFTTHTCTECGDSYVDDYTDALDHSYEAVVTAPTYEAQGYTTYTCTVCGYSYEGDFVPALVYHEVLEGEDAQWSPESGEPVSVHVDADIANFVEVLLNGQVLDEEYYTLTEGSTIVTLKPEYLATLPTGEHTLELIFTDGSAEVTFEILAPAVTLGDVNEDGEIDILDANLVVAWYNEVRELEDDQLLAADVNGDGEVDIMDANMIVAYYNEVIDAFPVK